MKKVAFILFLFSFTIFSQSEYIKRESSYTPNSALKKEIRNYPFIKVVEPILPNDVNSLRNITYVKYGNRELKLDLFFIKRNQSLRPGVIVLHGGGWQTGDKSLLFPLAIKLAEKDYVAASIEYRLSPEAKFPAAILDITNAIKWIKNNGNNYGIDTNKIALLGSSAGGHLASLVGFAQNLSEYQDTTNYLHTSSNIKAVINIDGVMDFLGEGSEEFDDVPDPNNPRAAHKWIGFSHLENPELWSKVSPISYINEFSCPILFINSSKPRFHAGRDEAVEMLKNFSVYHEVHTIENTPHSFWLFHPWFNTTFDLVSNFLEVIFGKN